MTVEELFHRVMTRLTGPAQCSVFEALREVQAIVCNRLLLKQAAELKKSEPAEIELAAGEALAYLPSDFYALDGRPYLLGQRQLAPLAGADTAGLQTAGTPRFYEQAGRALRLWPVPAEAAVLQVPYFFRPPILTELTDELPFHGAFDGALVEGCVAVSAAGLAAVADRSLVAVIQSQVDGVLLAQELLSEQLLADALNVR